MRRIKIPPEHVVKYAYLKLFPVSTRRLLLRGRRVRYKGAPDWFNLVQQLGFHLYRILEGIIAAYIFERWRSRANRKTLVLTDVLERVPEGDVVTYQHLLRKADLLVKSRDPATPEAVITIIEKHRTLESALWHQKLFRSLRVNGIQMPIRPERLCSVHGNERYVLKLPTARRW
jgi:hypothetical protein